MFINKKRYNPMSNRDKQFEQWLRKIDRRLVMITGMGVDDLPDWDYMSAFDDGMDVDEVLEEIAVECGFEELM